MNYLFDLMWSSFILFFNVVKLYTWNIQPKCNVVFLLFYFFLFLHLIFLLVLFNIMINSVCIIRIRFSFSIFVRNTIWKIRELLIFPLLVSIRIKCVSFFLVLGISLGFFFILNIHFKFFLSFCCFSCNLFICQFQILKLLFKIFNIFFKVLLVFV